MDPEYDSANSDLPQAQKWPTAAPSQSGQVDTGSANDDLPEEHRPAQVRATNILTRNARAGKSFEDASKELSQAIPGTDTAPLKDYYENLGPSLKLQDAHKALAHSDETASSITSRHLLPWGSELVSYRQAREHADAQGRVKDRTASDQDYQTIAAYERAQHLDQNRDLRGKLGLGVLSIPKVAGEFFVGGAIARGLGKAGMAMGRAAGVFAAAAPEAAITAAPIAMPMLTKLGIGAAKAVGTTAFVPAMYVEKWIHDNEANGRDPTDLKGLPAAYAMGTLQILVLGGVAEAMGTVGGTGPAAWAARAYQGTKAGLAGQATVDVAASVISQFIPKGYKLEEGYGVPGRLVDVLMRKPGAAGEAAQQLLVQAVTFAGFSAFHAGPDPHAGFSSINPKFDPKAGFDPQFAKEEMQRFTKTMYDMSQRGLNPVKLNQAYDTLAEVVAKNPSPTKAEISKAMEALPEGPVRDFGLGMADKFPGEPAAQEVQEANAELKPGSTGSLTITGHPELSREAPKTAQEKDDTLSAQHLEASRRFNAAQANENAVKDLISKGLNRDAELKAAKRERIDAENEKERISKELEDHRAATIKAEADAKAAEPPRQTINEQGDLPTADEELGLPPSLKEVPAEPENRISQNDTPVKEPQPAKTEMSPAEASFRSVFPEAQQGVGGLIKGKTATHTITMEPGSEPNAVKLDFYKNPVPGENYKQRVDKMTQVGAKLEPGSLDVARKLRTMVKGLKEAGAKIEYVTDGHAKIYEQALARLGYRQTEGPVEEGPNPVFRAWEPISKPAEATEPVKAAEAAKPAAADAAEQDKALDDLTKQAQGGKVVSLNDVFDKADLTADERYILGQIQEGRSLRHLEAEGSVLKPNGEPYSYEGIRLIYKRSVKKIAANVTEEQLDALAEQSRGEREDAEAEVDRIASGKRKLGGKMASEASVARGVTPGELHSEDVKHFVRERKNLYRDLDAQQDLIERAWAKELQDAGKQGQLPADRQAYFDRLLEQVGSDKKLSNRQVEKLNSLLGEGAGRSSVEPTPVRPEVAPGVQSGGKAPGPEDAVQAAEPSAPAHPEDTAATGGEREASGHELNQETLPDDLSGPPVVRDQERVARVMKERSRGLSIRAIADKLGVPRATVERDIARSGESPEETQERLAAWKARKMADPDEEAARVARVRAMRSQGMTFQEIADKEGVPYGTIVRDATRPEQTAESKAARRAILDLDEQAGALRDQGLTIAEIAAKTGVALNTVKAALVRAGRPLGRLPGPEKPVRPPPREIPEDNTLLGKVFKAADLDANERHVLRERGLKRTGDDIAGDEDLTKADGTPYKGGRSTVEAIERRAMGKLRAKFPNLSPDFTMAQLVEESRAEEAAANIAKGKNFEPADVQIDPEKLKSAAHRALLPHEKAENRLDGLLAQFNKEMKDAGGKLAPQRQEEFWAEFRRSSDEAAGLPPEGDKESEVSPGAQSGRDRDYLSGPPASPKTAAGPGGERIGQHDIIETIKRDFDVPVYPGGESARYNLRNESVDLPDMRAGEAPLLTHELAHHLAKTGKIDLDPAKLPQDVVRGFQQFDYQSGRANVPEAMQEGFAEWLRMRSTDSLPRLSPEQEAAAKYAEKAIAEFKRPLDKLKGLFGQYEKQTPLQKYGGTISQTGKQAQPIITPGEAAADYAAKAWEATQTALLDDLTPTKRAEAEAMRRGMKFQPGTRLSEVAAVNRLSSVPLANDFQQGGMNKVVGGKQVQTGRPLAEITKDVDADTLENVVGPFMKARQQLFQATLAGGAKNIPVHELDMAQAAMKEFRGRPDAAQLEKVADAITREVFDAGLDSMVQDGRISQAAAAKWQKENPFYATMKRVLGEDFDAPGQGKPGSGSRDFMKARSGETGEQTIGLTQAIQERYLAVARVRNQQAKFNALLELAKAEGVGEWISPGKRGPNGEVLGVEKSEKHPQITGYVNGEAIHIPVNSKPFYEMYMGTQGEGTITHSALKGLGDIMQWTRIPQTIRGGGAALSWLYHMMSPIRDPIVAMQRTVRDGNTFENLADLGKWWGKSFSWYWRAMLAGGSGKVDIKQASDRMFAWMEQKAGREMDVGAQSGQKTFASRAMDGWHGFYQRLTDLLGAGERGTRVWEAKNVLEKDFGLTPEKLDAQLKLDPTMRDPVPYAAMIRALDIASQITHNTHQMGSSIRQLNRAWPFLGAHIAGTYKDVANAIAQPGKAAAGLAILGAAKGIEWLMNKDDKEYNEIAPYLRTGFVFKTPLGWIHLPAPRGLNGVVTGMMGEALRATSDNNPRFVEMMERSLEEIAPHGGPEPVTTGVHMAANRSWTGRPIIPDREADRMSMGERMRDPRALGYAAQQLSGGMLSQRRLSVNPFRMDQNPHQSVTDYYEALHSMETQRAPYVRDGKPFPDEAKYHRLQYVSHAMGQLDAAIKGERAVKGRTYKSEPPTPEQVSQYRQTQIDLAKRAMGQ